MRISIREQLGLLVLFVSLLALMVLALATWFQNKAFITDIRLSGLSLTASLKAAQLSSTLLLYSAQVRSVSTRVLIQSALQRYRNGNDTDQNWQSTQTDLAGALANGETLVQAAIFPAIDNGNQTALDGLVNVTSPSVLGMIKLPYSYENGSDVYLGDPGFGYPPPLYPNLTYNANGSVSYEGRSLNPTGALFLGPLIINETFALLSVTTAVINNTSFSDILGWVTVCVDISMIFDIQNSREGLGQTGEVLIVGPVTTDNHFDPEIRATESTETIAQQYVHFVLPPSTNSTVKYRHSSRSGAVNSSAPFPITSFPAVLDAWTADNRAVNNAGSILSSHNEQDDSISVGYATIATPMVDWVLLVEQAHDEVVSPINHLRDVVLICVFCTTAILLVASFPLAHYSIAPIRHLRSATAKTVEPYQPDDASVLTGESFVDEFEDQEDVDEARKEGFMGMFSNLRSKSTNSPTTGNRHRRRTFRIPSKVPERKHWITDELTELTSTFNEMSDELAMQYQRLEERVKERTAELEKSKEAAEAANQSKTLFIANISHELKTPLNGILGLTTVCMNEDDPSRIKSTLNTIYKSGDLLLHLLTDLLTFSKNEVGQHISIDEAEFRLNDLSTQLIPTFDTQAKEAQIDLKVLYIGSNDAFGNSSDESGPLIYGPTGTGRVQDMCLWGDKNRILQVLMNFVSNSLKFTPPHGSVTVRIKCTGLAERRESRTPSARQSSLISKQSKNSSKKRGRTSDASLAMPHHSSDDEKRGVSNAKLSINLAGGTHQIAKIATRRRSMSPPPLNTKDLMFEFEVEDTGPGVPEEQQKKIFEPFVQGDLGLSKKYGGTGLGLSICAQLAALMGGDLSLDSKVGSGSKFAMRLPLRYLSEKAASTMSSRRTLSVSGPPSNDDPETALVQKPQSQSQSQSSGEENTTYRRRSEIPRVVGLSQPYMAKEVTSRPKLNAMKQAENQAAKSGKKIRVLVAEDNKVNQEVVLRMLKLEEIYGTSVHFTSRSQTNYVADVTIAKDGQEAFELVRDSMQLDETQRYDLVFMDIQMPNVDGIQSTKLIRGMGFNAPIVALTAFAEKSNEDECMASGMDYFLAKPIRRPALKHVLKKYCSTIVEEDSVSTNGVIPSSTARPTTQPTDSSTLPSTTESTIQPTQPSTLPLASGLTSQSAYSSTTGSTSQNGAAGKESGKTLSSAKDAVVDVSDSGNVSPLSSVPQLTDGVR